MQSRTPNNWPFNPNISLGTINLLVEESNLPSTIVPPVAGDFLLLEGDDFLLLDGTNFLLL